MSTKAYLDQYGRRLTRQRIAIGFAFEVAIEPLHLFVAPVRVAYRIDEHHHVLANATDHRLIRNR